MCDIAGRVQKKRNTWEMHFLKIDQNQGWGWGAMVVRKVLFLGCFFNISKNWCFLNWCFFGKISELVFLFWCFYINFEIGVLFLVSF